MKITQWSEYGIQFLVHIARRTIQGEAVVGAADIAYTQDVDLQYAQQILQRLRKGMLIESVRGPCGGYRLSRAPKEITMFDVIMAAEGATLEMVGKRSKHPAAAGSDIRPCNFSLLWQDFKDYLDTYLRGCTLEDLAKAGDEGRISLSEFAAHSARTGVPHGEPQYSSN